MADLQQDDTSAPRWIERGFRVLGAGLLFVSFGVGAVLLAGLVLPVVSAIGRDDPRRRELRAQRLIRDAFRLFIWMGSASRLWRVRMIGAERLAVAGALVVANHPTLIDVVILIGRMPQADCVVKREAWNNPFLRGIVRAAGYIPNDGGEALVEACSERLRAGRSVLLFPEGSRSPAVGVGPFKRGAARIALASGCPVTPVAISCTPPALKKGQAWYALPNRRFEYTLTVGSPMDATVLAGGESSQGRAARRATAALRSYFEERDETRISPATEADIEPGAEAKRDDASS